MRIKVFCTPGNHRDDFGTLEQQINDWLEAEKPTDVHFNSCVNSMGREAAQGGFMLTVVVQYEPRG